MSLRHAGYAQYLAFDLSGSVLKMAYISAVPQNKTSTSGQVTTSEEPALYLNVFQFYMDELESILGFIVQECTQLIRPAVITVISNAHSVEMETMIIEKLDAEIRRVEEPAAIFRGTDFLLRNILDESFRFVSNENGQPHYAFDTIDLTKPYLIASVGTGLSILRVEGDGSFKRLIGSSIGSGTFIAIAALVFGVTDLDEMVRLAAMGDNKRVDKLVGDIYGGAKHALGLDNNQVAGSLSKLKDAKYVAKLKKEGTFAADGLNSLLMSFSFNISQVVALSAELDKPKIPPARIFFDGTLIRNYPYVMQTITRSTAYWSNDAFKTHFFRHEGYGAVIGALLLSEKIGDFEKLSWRENLAGCSPFSAFVPKVRSGSSVEFTSLELVCTRSKLSWFPLLDPQEVYSPDTLDFQDDNDSRQKWIQILGSSQESVMKRAVRSQGDTEDAQSRGKEFLRVLDEKMQLLVDTPQAHGSCNARDLLDIREHLLLDYGFDDLYIAQKALENDRGLTELPQHLETIDSISSPSDRLLLVTKCLLAGNVFDWGAKEVVALLQRKQGVTFENALQLLRPRPWLIDSYDKFSTKVDSGAYKSVLIFCDNSGADFVLGILPFTRELLKRGIKVLLAVNQLAALNDMTYAEAIELMEKVVKVDEIIATAWSNEDLLVMHNGQGSPCLDFRTINSLLNEAVVKRSIDLIIIEGMGRALHTNLKAKFTVDCIKAAVIKTEWLAKILNGEIFDGVFQLDEAVQSVDQNEE